MLSGLNTAATRSKLLGKEITYAGHGDFDGSEAQLGKHSLFKQIFEPLWLGTKVLLGRANETVTKPSSGDCRDLGLCSFAALYQA